MSKSKRNTDKELLHKMTMGAVRGAMKDQGFFDGRFRPKMVASGKAYKRNKKHKGNDGDE